MGLFLSPQSQHIYILVGRYAPQGASSAEAERISLRHVAMWWQKIHQSSSLVPLNKNERGMKVSDWSAELMNWGHFTVSTVLQQVPLTVASVGEMGFSEPTRYDRICEWIKAHGDLCQPEDGPQLRLQYPD